MEISVIIATNILLCTITVCVSFTISSVITGAINLLYVNRLALQSYNFITCDYAIVHSEAWKMSNWQLSLPELLVVMKFYFPTHRLIYWVSVAMGSSVRGMGFGFSFLPTLAMLGANLYFIFMLDAGGSIFAIEDLVTPEPPPPPKQRFWG